MDKLLKQKNPDVISVYLFYLYTALWQSNDQPKATDKYCQNGLGIGYRRFHEAQIILFRLKLIKRIKHRKNGKISGWYIKVTAINQGAYNFVENNKVEADVKTAETPYFPLLREKPNSRESTNKYNNTFNENTEFAETDVSALSVDVKKHRKKMTPPKCNNNRVTITDCRPNPTDADWRWLDSKNPRNCKYQDDMLFLKCTDGYYRDASHSIYIP